MILDQFVLLAAITSRSQAYLQAMIKADLLPAKCILYTDDFEASIEAKNTTDLNECKSSYFDRNESLVTTLKLNNIPYDIVQNKDINSDEMKVYIETLPQQYFIYSGYGGYILKADLFDMGKKFIHIHAGILPSYRGSTTAYYSLLQENNIGATAIFMSAGIDEGDIIIFQTYEPPVKGVDIDYIYEPYVRSQVLIKALKSYVQTGKLIGGLQNNDQSETYFIIHPLLKHLAIMGSEHDESHK